MVIFKLSSLILAKLISKSEFYHSRNNCIVSPYKIYNNLLGKFNHFTFTGLLLPIICI